MPKAIFESLDFLPSWAVPIAAIIVPLLLIAGTIIKIRGDFYDGNAKKYDSELKRLQLAAADPNNMVFTTTKRVSKPTWKSLLFFGVFIAVPILFLAGTAIWFGRYGTTQYHLFIAIASLLAMGFTILIHTIIAVASILLDSYADGIRATSKMQLSAFRGQFDIFRTQWELQRDFEENMFRVIAISSGAPPEKIDELLCKFSKTGTSTTPQDEN